MGTARALPPRPDAESGSRAGGRDLPRLRIYRRLPRPVEQATGQRTFGSGDHVSRRRSASTATCRRSPRPRLAGSPRLPCRRCRRQRSPCPAYLGRMRRADKLYVLALVRPKSPRGRLGSASPSHPRPRGSALCPHEPRCTSPKHKQIHLSATSGYFRFLSCAIPWPKNKER